MKRSMNRRAFVKQMAAVGGTLAVSYHVNPAPAPASQSPNEKLNLAAVGTMNRAGANIAGVAGQNLVALCDVDDNLLGNVAYRSGKKLEWDAALLKVTNAPEAQPFIHKEYRKGWTL